MPGHGILNRIAFLEKRFVRSGQLQEQQHVPARGDTEMRSLPNKELFANQLIQFILRHALLLRMQDCIPRPASGRQTKAKHQSDRFQRESPGILLRYSLHR